MRSKSSTRLQVKAISKQKEPSIVGHRKEIQNTLRELHRLQSQIYELNVPENPHSSSPVKKQIKQLSYLYQNMAKPKSRNTLNMKSQDIQLAVRIMNQDWDLHSKLQEEINDEGSRLGQTKSNLRNDPDASYKMPKQVLQTKFQTITNCSINLAFINEDQDCEDMSVRDLYTFFNYTETDDFDPVADAYRMFLNDKDEFDINIYNQFNGALGLPKIKSLNTMIAAVNHAIEPVGEGQETLTLEQFREIVKLEL